MGPHAALKHSESLEKRHTSYRYQVACACMVFLWKLHKLYQVSSLDRQQPNIIFSLVLHLHSILNSFPNFWNFPFRFLQHDYDDVVYLDVNLITNYDTTAAYNQTACVVVSGKLRSGMRSRLCTRKR